MLPAQAHVTLKMRNFAMKPSVGGGHREFNEQEQKRIKVKFPSLPHQKSIIRVCPKEKTEQNEVTGFAHKVKKKRQDFAGLYSKFLL